MSNNFCLTNDGALTPCPTGYTRGAITTTTSTTAMPLLEQAMAEARTDGGTVVNTAYTNLDFHPTTDVWHLNTHDHWTRGLVLLRVQKDVP